jgi:3-hydroxyisobutyrate dehydrogenase-like beta-hydroxyacid dehydrogenase
MLENRLPHIVEADYSPHSAINIWLKDLGIVADISKETSFIPHLALAALERYRAAADQGLGLEDDAAIVKPYAKEAGITLP